LEKKMKNRLLILLITFVISILPFRFLYAFENVKTHPAMTERAAITSTIDNYLKNQIGLNDGINTELFYDFSFEIKSRIERAEWDGGKTTRTLLEWLKVGSAIEDTDLYPVKPRRPRHHFYDPYRNTGLNNRDDNPNFHGGPEVAMNFKGGSALMWAVNGTAPYAPTSNEQAWHNARTDLYSSLTENLKDDREKYLAMTFLDLGCVLHMLEDMGVPAHTRNDFLFAHYRKYDDYGEPLESWIEKMIPSGGSLGRWISGGWTPTPQVFSKVSDYFDAGLYTGNYLGYDVPTPCTWGLSERTNYQFLSWTTIFDANFLTSLYWFPNPAKINTAEVNESGRTYLAGYGVDHLAQQTMSQHHLQHDHLNRAWCVLGEAIYDDYAEITIPRTIDYATGLANYFFRGRLSATAECIECNTIELTVTNLSDNSGTSQTLKGGTFELYWDDAAGNRTPITAFVIDGGWTSGSTLAYNGNITITFIKPTGVNPVKYVVVYKGNICENPADTDSDDENAIAMTTVTAPDDCCIGSPCPYCTGDTPRYLELISTSITPCTECKGWNISYSMNFSYPLILTQTANPCVWELIMQEGITKTVCDDGEPSPPYSPNIRARVILYSNNIIDILVGNTMDNGFYYNGTREGSCGEGSYENSIVGCEYIEHTFSAGGSIGVWPK
jgi:hypothetical protein